MRSFRVLIMYREPTVESHRGWGARPYSGVFVVRAATPAAATARAMDAFEDIALRSGVSWLRQIVTLETRELDDAVPERLDGAAA